MKLITNLYIYAIMIQFIGVIARIGYLLSATRCEGKRVHNAAPLHFLLTSPIFDRDSINYAFNYLLIYWKFVISKGITHNESLRQQKYHSYRRSSKINTIRKFVCAWYDMQHRFNLYL